MPYCIFKWFYMYAKCLHTSSYSKYSCAIPGGLKHPGKEKGASQHTRLLATKREKKKKGKSIRKKKNWKQRGKQEVKRKIRKSTTAGPDQPETCNKAEEAIQPTSGTATTLGVE